MKPNKKLEYIRAIDLARLPVEEREKYDKDVMSLRKKLRSLVAFQDNANEEDEHSMKPTINNIIKYYGLDGDIREVTTDIMKTFFGYSEYMDKIIPIYERKNRYDALPANVKKAFAKSYSPVDYFDIPTLYHYYNFRKRILDLHKKNISGEQSFERNPKGFDKIISTAYSEYLAKSDKTNMFFKQSDLRLLMNDPIKSYTNLMGQKEKFMVKVNEDESLTEKEKIGFEEVKISDVIKGEVNSYMISYVDQTKTLPDKDKIIEELKTYYTVRATKTIKSRMLVKPAEKFMIEAYNYAGLTEDQLEEINPTPKKFTQQPTVQQSTKQEEKYNGPKVGDQLTFF